MPVFPPPSPSAPRARRRQPRGRAAPLAAALALALLPAVGSAQEALLDSLQQQLRDHRLPAALATARQAVDAVPGHAGLWYNLAGLEQQVGDRGRAAAALRQAVVHGFDDFRHADQDPELADLRERPVYAELRAAWASGLAARADQRTRTLAAGQWSDPIDLPDRAGGLTPPRASARLRPAAHALQIEVTVDGSTELTRAPWHGGGGVFVWVGAPAAAAEGRGGTELAVGLAESLPAGAVRLGRSWQRLAELTPKLRILETDRLRYEFTVPWSACRPHHPLVDRPLLINLSVVTEAGGRASGHAAWLDDPATGEADRPWRRGVPVTVTWPAASGPALQGRPARTLLREGALAVDPLAAVLPDDGPASARLVLRDRRGEVAWEKTVPLPGGAGRRTAAVSGALDVPAGSLRLGATLTGAGLTDPPTWETALVHLPDGWLAGARERARQAPAAERASLRWRLDAIADAAASHTERAPAGALGTTVDEVESLLARLQATGSTLPAGGPYLAAAPDIAGRGPLACSLALPDGWRPGDPATVVLLLARAPGAADRAVPRVPRLLAERAERTGTAPPPVILAWPHLPREHDPGLARARATDLLGWLRDFLGSGPVHVAGVDLLAATALELAAARPADVAAVLALTGLNFTPYPDATPADLGARLADLPSDLPVGWYWFPDEQRDGDQAAALRQALQARGLAVSPARAIPGGLDATQAWTRSVTWAAGLAP